MKTFDLISCYLNTALALQDYSNDEMRRYVKNDPGNKSWVEKFIMCFFLYRQGLEVALIALYKEKTGQEFKGHDLKALWETNFIDRLRLKRIVEQAIRVLETFEVLQDLTLFQYHESPYVEELPLIDLKDFAILDKAGRAIQEELVLLKQPGKFSAQVIEFKKPTETKT